MASHGCVGNPCWICFPEYAPWKLGTIDKSDGYDRNLIIPFLPKLDDEPDKIWKMRYKDEDSNEAPWQKWESTDKPSEMLIEALRKEGMHRLEIIN